MAPGAEPVLLSGWFMASYRLFITDLRIGSLNYNESTEHWWA